MLLYKSRYLFIWSKIIRCGKDTNANIRRHLGNVHGFVDLKSKSHPASFRNTTVSTNRKVELDNAAIRCIIRDGRSYGDFRREGMADFLAAAAPGYKGPHSRTIQRNVKRLYSNKLHVLHTQLQTIQHVAITTDMWKRTGKHHYLGVTIHYVDQDWNIVHKVLSFRRFHGRHLAKLEEKEGFMRNVGRRCTGCYAKGRIQRSREASYAAAKKVKTFCSDCEKFFVLSVLMISIMLWSKEFK